MAAITIEIARQKLQTWLDAEDAIATGQEYFIGGQRMRRADLDMVAERVAYWSRLVERLEQGGRGPRVRYAVPV